jgi:hypothetical protein
MTFQVFTALAMKNSASGMLRRVALVRIDVSEALSSSETSGLTRAARCKILENGILQLYSVLKE